MLARLLLVVALLAVQHAALSHELWHLDGERGEPSQQTLCDFHDALSVVAGAVHGAPCGHASPVVHEAVPGAGQVPAALAAKAAPCSRDPPAASLK